MRQALILCGGKAKRLRPYSHILPKASLPFLNLPLLSLSWFYLEQLKASRFLLNSHLFPDKLENTVDFLSQSHQTTALFFEEEPLGAVGALRKLQKELKQTKEFVYINGDSLFFPSQIKHIVSFERVFVDSNSEALFFATPYKKTDSNRALWCDRDFNLKFIGFKESLASHKLDGLTPFSWLGMALFKSDLLDHLPTEAFDLFQDFINPLLKEHKIKIYSDPLSVFLEAGEKKSYLTALEFCLNCLFQSEKLSGDLDFDRKEKGAVKQAIESPDEAQIKTVKEILESCFKRFDPKDDKVGLQNGKIWGQELNYPVLLPKSVCGLHFLKLQGPAVVGSEARFVSNTVLDRCVLDSQIAFKGYLREDILINAFLTPRL